MQRKSLDSIPSPVCGNNINIDNIYVYYDINDYSKISEFIKSNYQIAKENIKHVET